MADSQFLSITSLETAGRRLGLREGDRLIAINGAAFTGSAADLNARFKQTRGALALSFERKGRSFMVLSRTPALARWTREAANVHTDDLRRFDPAHLSNWEVWCNAEGLYDVVRLDRSILALVMPPIWLLQQRLWRPFGAWAAMTLFAAVVGLIGMAAVQPLAGLVFWKSGVAITRAERRSRGFTPRMIVAAVSESTVHRQVARLAPDLSSVYAPNAASPSGAAA